MNLDKHTLKRISTFLEARDIRNAELHAELLDHLCAAVEEKEHLSDLDLFLQLELDELAPQGSESLELNYHISSFKKHHIIMKQIMYTTGLLSSISLATGILFKLMHWPYANLMLLAGVFFLFLIFIPYSAYRNFKALSSSDKLNKARLILGVLTSVIVAISIIFKVYHLMGASILFVVGMGIGILGFLPLQFVHFYRKSNSLTSKAQS